MNRGPMPAVRAQRVDLLAALPCFLACQCGQILHVRLTAAGARQVANTFGKSAAAELAGQVAGRRQVEIRGGELQLANGVANCRRPAPPAACRSAYAARAQESSAAPARRVSAAQSECPARAVIARLRNAAGGGSANSRIASERGDCGGQCATIGPFDTRTERRACRRREDAARGTDAISLGTRCPRGGSPPTASELPILGRTASRETRWIEPVRSVR
jgi:hypothetical protein